jgi:hypothetical protein
MKDIHPNLYYLLIPEAQVWFQASPRTICGG